MLEKTDEEHYITMPEIMESLAEYDITADRKSIYADLRDLSVLGIEVEGEPVGNRYHYHVVNRMFELPELKLVLLLRIHQKQMNYWQSMKCIYPGFMI